jgi:uncharacterized membrane protein
MMVGVRRISQHRRPRSPTGDGGPGRLIAFSDGVLAVIITIMALGLRPPDGTTLHALGHRLPALLVYVLSFTSIGIYWNNHHHLLRATERINGAVMWANLHLLFWLSLVPVMTEWVGNDYRYHLPAAAYGAVALGAAIAYDILFRTIVAANGRDSAIALAIGSDRKGRVSEVIYAVAIGAAFLSPYAAYALFVVVAVMWLVPDRRLASHRLAPPPEEPGDSVFGAVQPPE